MLLVGPCFFVLVTVRAGEDGIVAGVGVTVGAGGPLATVTAGIDRELVVRESCARPGSGRVTRGARRRERSGNVVRVAHAGVVALVA